MQTKYYNRKGVTKRKGNCYERISPCGLRAFYSYITIVGFQDYDGVYYVRRDSISMTTSKHRNILGRYAYTSGKLYSLSEADFLARLEQSGVSRIFNYTGGR